MIVKNSTVRAVTFVTLALVLMLTVLLGPPAGAHHGKGSHAEPTPSPSPSPSPTPIESCTTPADPGTWPPTVPTQQAMDHEEGDQSDWQWHPTNPDNWAQMSGTGAWAVTQGRARSGQYALDLSIVASDTTSSGSRAFVNNNLVDQNHPAGTYISEWVCVPRHVTIANSVSFAFWNLYQIKSAVRNNGITQTDANGKLLHDPIFALHVENRPAGPMYFTLSDKRAEWIHRLPPSGNITHEQTVADLTPGQWHHVEGYVLQNDYGIPNGRITFWQDGQLLFDLQDVETRHDPEDFGFPVSGGGSSRNVVAPANVYGRGLRNTDDGSFEIHTLFDNVAVTTEKVGP